MKCGIALTLTYLTPPPAAPLPQGTTINWSPAVWYRGYTVNAGTLAPITAIQVAATTMLFNMGPSHRLRLLLPLPAPALSLSLFRAPCADTRARRELSPHSARLPALPRRRLQAARPSYAHVHREGPLRNRYARRANPPPPPSLPAAELGLLARRFSPLLTSVPASPPLSLPPPSPGAGAISGLISGPSESVIIQQQRTGKGAGATFSSMRQAAGVSGILRGTPFAMFRDGLFTAGFLAVAPLLAQQARDQGLSEVPARLAGSVAAGVMAAVVTHPADTIKTRLQGDYMGEKYKSVRAVVAEGGLFKGLSARGSSVEGERLLRGLRSEWTAAAPFSSTPHPVSPTLALTLLINPPPVLSQARASSSAWA